ncbi:dsp1-1-like protein [Cordyceps javanica]|uniref:Dsp1-1-like protein n=1 Tax=Cordyceps javanica TaxID=43265 RepID=A0A545UKV7_9HYPO|nr:dsp1-1-like protein [Cordyceps javanica]
MSAHVPPEDASVIRQVGTLDFANWRGLAVFARLAGSPERSRRFDNLSWRLWQVNEIRLGPTSSDSRRDRHISSDDLKNRIASIVNDNALLSAPTATSPLATPKKEMVPVASAPIAAKSITSMAIELKFAPDARIRTGDALVRGSFPQPSQVDSDATIPKPKAAPAHRPVTLKQAPAKFALGGSCSSDEQGMSVELSMSNLKNTMFGAGGSCNSQLEGESAVDSDTEDDYVNESAIDDDDDWGNCTEDSSTSSIDDNFFQRVKPEANLVSRPSLITLMLAQRERQKNLSRQVPHSTSAIIRSPNDSDEGPLMMKGMRPSNLRLIIEMPRSKAQPIVAPTKHVHPQAVLSPRTTRRNMLTNELTESLRRHLLWERQQKNSTADAVLKRRHTSRDVAI